MSFPENATVFPWNMRVEFEAAKLRGEVAVILPKPKWAK